MTIENTNMGEQPIFSCKAHVFHIDPKTKRSWIPASTSAVSVSFFFDSNRQLYRIISVEGTKAVINSTITPNMMFTKTSQKFGQWSDMRANTVYGLGFSTEAELNKFIEKFQEVKESTRSGKTNGSAANQTSSGQSNAAGGGTIGAQQPVGSSSASASPLTSRSKAAPQTIQPPQTDSMADMSVMMPPGMQGNESPKHKQGPPSDNKAPGLQSTAPAGDSHVQLKYENDRLKLALAQSSANAKKWEIELNSLKTTNARLTSALQESTANVEEWKKQLQTYKEENTRMKNKILELESGGGRVICDGDESTEIKMLRTKLASLEGELDGRDNTIDDLRSQLIRTRASDDHKERLQQALEENEQLRVEAAHTQSQLEVAMATQDTQRNVVENVNQQFGERLKDLLTLHSELTRLLST